MDSQIVENIVDHEIDNNIEEDFSEDLDYSNEINICRIDRSSEDVFKKRNMELFEQKVDREKNSQEGWSNPVLSNNKELNNEVLHYQSIYNNLENCSKKDEQNLKDELNLSFKRIAGYYCNYEKRWYDKMGHLFDEPALFYDFFYDLLRDCIIAFKANGNSIDHENNFRKANSGVYFNQYFFGALSKRKITNIKKAMSISDKPSVICKVCGDKVVKITDFHLRHEYDEVRLNKDFKTSLVKKGKNRVYERCPICDEENVTVSHLKNHNYAEVMTVNDYVKRYPDASLCGSLKSLQEPISFSEDGNQLTYEDIYQNSLYDSSDKEKIESFSNHIDEIFEDDNLMANILKLKILDYNDKEIAEKLSNTYEFKIEYNISKYLRRKNRIFEYVKSNMNDMDFFKNNKEFHIINRERKGDYEFFKVSTMSPIEIGSALKKLRKNKKKLSLLFER